MIILVINNDYRVQDNILLLNDDFCIYYQYYVPVLMKFQSIYMLLFIISYYPSYLGKLNLRFFIYSKRLKPLIGLVDVSNRFDWDPRFASISNNFLATFIFSFFKF